MPYEEMTREELIREIRLLRKESEERYRSLFDTTLDGIYQTDAAGKFVLVNPAAARIFGYDSPAEMLGHYALEYWCEATDRETFRTDLAREKSVSSFHIRAKNKAGEPLELESTSRILEDNEGRFLGIEGILRDITGRIQAEKQIRTSLKEKEILLRELYHRTKNNMQVIISLLNLQAESISDDAVLQIFRDTRSRIRSMSLVHEKLCQSADLSAVDLRGYIEDLALSILKAYRKAGGTVRLKLNIDAIGVSIDTITPLGLIINELLSNSLKHAFPDNREGEIEITFFREDADRIGMRYRDNGSGLAHGYNPRTAKTLGMQLIFNLAENQLHADLEILTAKPDEGFEVVLRLKNEKARVMG